ncbi:MAG: hypothetical protein DMF49_00385 [Acidobacteria bacterium]|nr:MAG: hypothetical protein DMF49_00385 [Acidobacteriota bacterium]
MVSSSAPSPGPGGSQERRAHPRVPLRLPILASYEQQSFLLQPLDISLGGVGCRSDRRLPLMKHVTVSVEISGGHREPPPVPLGLDAVVARCEPAGAGFAVWHLGLYFVYSRSSEVSRNRLAHFIGRSPTSPPTGNVPKAEP